MIYITRRERFNAAHKLYNENWSVEKNDEVFGKCANANWHGHNFDLIVTVKGEIDPDTGFVMNLKDLSRIIKDEVIEKVDHKNLNLDVDFMKGKYPSTEILAMEFWNILAPLIKAQGAELHYIKLVETENNYVEYYGN